MSTLNVYKASAGSGKTFTLAAEYIKLLVQDPRAYRHVLAVTFTNKATTEMKERILGQLYGIWTGDPGATPYLQLTQKALGWDEERIRKAAGVALQCMTHDYSRFRVETIDSFFQSVMRNLARELELGANLDISLNNEEVLSQAVDQMIEKLDRQAPVLYWLLDLIEEKIANDKRWNVAGEIKQFGMNIFNEAYLEKGGGLREKLKDKNCVRDYRNKLNALAEEAKEQMKSFAEQFFGVLETNGITVDDLKNKSKGIAGYFLKLAAGQTDDKVRGATVVKCLDNPEEWVKKASPMYETIVALANDELIPLLEEAEEFRERNHRIITSCQLSLGHLNNLRLLSHIDSEVRELNHERGRFLLSDTNALLHGLISEGDPSFVFEKTGATLHHVMIDEFQDTSRLQWDNFRLLLMEGLSQGSDSLVVGDVKQSIYRWRNADWSILLGLKDHLGPFPVAVQTLTTNRRSAGNIVRFNNEIFTAACCVLDAISMANQGEPCAPLNDAYSDVRQQTCKEPEKGYVRVNFLSKKEQITYEDETLTQLATEVDRLVACGVSQKDIAILVRRNKNIPMIAAYFDKNTPYRIVSDEAFRLDASPAVCLIVDAIRLLSDPDDHITLARLASTYQREVLQVDFGPADLLVSDISRLLPEDYATQTNSLRLIPLSELVEKLAKIFQTDRIEKQEAYLCAFFDTVTDYLHDNSSELSAFITCWDDELCGKTIPSGEADGIRILSIHKSKGLEFHSVLIPFCDWRMGMERTDNLVWCEPQEAPYDELDLVPVSFSAAMLQSIYSQDYLREHTQLWVDNLNLLYVAFTRAEKNLIIWGKEGSTGTVSQLLEQAMEGFSEPEAPFPMTSQKEPDIIYEAGTVCTDAPGQKAPSENKLLAIPQPITLRMETLEASIAFRQSNQSAAFIRGEEEEREQYIRQGQLLHHLFATIHTTADVPAAITRLRMEGLIGSDQQEMRISQLTEWAMSQPWVKDWYSGQWELFNECAIICQTEQGVQTRRPDRVMVRDGRAVVVDFKFGKKQAAYRDQVREYMNLLSQMGYQHIQGYLWYIFNNELEEVDASASEQ